MRPTRLFAAAALIAGVPAMAVGQATGFPPMPTRDVTTPPFADADVERLLKALDSLIAAKPDTKPAAKPAAKPDTKPDTVTLKKIASLHFWRLMSRLQTGQLSAAQEAKVIAHFDKIESQFPAPADREFVESYKKTVQGQMIGKVAPEIVGKDYDGVEFKLSDYRGKVTVLYFTGQWCGPCRGEYPYERLMLEVHKAEPFAIVAVNSDSSLEVAKKAKVDNKLDFRTWWDGYLAKSTSGPIASAWNVTGWPAIYVLDENGVIRFANLRSEDTLKGVKQLLEEQRQAKAKADKAKN